MARMAAAISMTNCFSSGVIATSRRRWLLAWKIAPLGHGPAEHVFQAHGLAGELEVIMQFLPFAAVLELDRKNGPIRVELHQIGLADEIEPITPDRQSTFHPHAGFDFVAGRIHQW